MQPSRLPTAQPSRQPTNQPTGMYLILLILPVSLPSSSSFSRYSSFPSLPFLFQQVDHHECHRVNPPSNLSIIHPHAPAYSPSVALPHNPPYNPQTLPPILLVNPPTSPPIPPQFQPWSRLALIQLLLPTIKYSIGFRYALPNQIHTPQSNISVKSSHPTQIFPACVGISTGSWCDSRNSRLQHLHNLHHICPGISNHGRNAMWTYCEMV